MNTPTLTHDDKTNLHRALSTILGERAPLVIDYESNSAALWALDIPNIKSLFKNGVVLVWDKPNSSLKEEVVIKNTEYINPLTWCVYVLRNCPELRLSVLDLDIVSHSMLKFYNVVQAIDSCRLPFLFMKVPFLVADCMSFLNQVTNLDQSKSVVDILARQISVNAILTERGQDTSPHALASLIGPLILMSNMGKEDSSGKKKEQKALRSLFTAVGLLDKSRKGSGDPLEIGEMKLVLFDDQALNGWEEWLKACLPEGKANQIKPLSASDEFVKFLDNCDRTNFAKKDLRFQFSMPGWEKDSWVLLLDVRLFAAGDDNEKVFFDKLADLIKKWDFTNETAGFGWDPIPKKEVGDVKNWANNAPGSKKPEDDVLLTLFPRFLALLDPSLPIVMFSTTLQPHIIQKLKDYGNIYTGLNKNPFSGGEAPIDYLRRNLPTILKYNKLRQKFRALDSIEGIEPAHADFQHWEIYIDESSAVEGNYFRVAGLMVGYKNDDQAKEVHDFMSAGGIRWLDKNNGAEILTGRPGEWLKKVRDDYGDLSKQWNSISKPLEKKLTELKLPTYSFCLFKELTLGATSVEEEAENPRLCSPNSLDNCYFSLLNDILEAALFDVLGMVYTSNPNPNPKPPTFKIFVASRRRVFNSVTANPKWKEDNRKNYAAFGVPLVLDGGHPAYQSLQMSGLLPVVSELLEKRSNHEIKQKLSKGIVFAAAVPLNDPGNRLEDGLPLFDKNCLLSPGYRHLHFIADIMASLARDGKYGDLTESIFGFGPKGDKKALFAQRDDVIVDLQQISRLLDLHMLNVLVAASLFYNMGEKVEETLDKGIFAKSVLLRLREALKTDLTGLQIRQLVFSLKPGTLGVVDQIEMLRSKHTNLYRQKLEIERTIERMLFRKFTMKWKIKSVSKQAYEEAHCPLLGENGYQVRISGDRQQIAVFADLDILGEANVPAGFGVPENINFMNNHGEPAGSYYQRN